MDDEQATSVVPRKLVMSVAEVVLTVCRYLQAYPSQSSDPVGVIVCKQSMHRDVTNRGYIAMLSVHKNWRKRGIGASPSPSATTSGLTGTAIASTLVRRTVEVMKKHGVEEVSSLCTVLSCRFHPPDTSSIPCRSFSRQSSTTPRLYLSMNR